MKLALFGGTFDPIHAGHIAVAHCALREENLDRVVFVPARLSPLKAGLPCASSAHRCAMIEIAIQDLPWASLWKGELDRPAPSYTWQTVAFFRNALPGTELCWILGADQWNTLASWARPGYLARSVSFLVFHRGARPVPLPGFQMKELPAVHPASSTAIRQGNHEYLDPRVARYIGAHGLYREPERGLNSQPVAPTHCGSKGRTDPDPAP